MYFDLVRNAFLGRWLQAHTDTPLPNSGNYYTPQGVMVVRMYMKYSIRGFCCVRMLQI